MRLIDADKLFGVIAVQEKWNVPDFVYESIINAPTVDAVKVVRCKDCKHLSVRSGALGVYQCAIHGDFPSGEYFCADGERREDAKIH